MPELTGPDRLLLNQVTDALRAADQFERVFDADDTDGVKRLRTIGRRAGRELGWKVRTLTSILDTGRVRVYIVVEESTPLRDELMSIRRRKLTRRALTQISAEDHIRPAD